MLGIDVKRDGGRWLRVFGSRRVLVVLDRAFGNSGWVLWVSRSGRGFGYRLNGLNGLGLRARLSRDTRGLTMLRLLRKSLGALRV